MLRCFRAVNDAVPDAVGSRPAGGAANNGR